MAYNRPSLYLTWGGRIGSAGAGVDIWQTGVKLALPTGVGAPDMPSLADLTSLYNDTIAPFHQASTMGISQGAVLQYAKVAPLGTDGAYTDDALTYEGSPTPGGVTTDRGGPQDSLAVSLWSGGALGKANYGRMYLPWNGFAIQSGDGRITNTQATNASITAGDFIDDINTWAEAASGIGVRVRIMSRVGTGSTKDVAYVRVGNVVDTQRRRRNRITETYFATPVAL